MSSQAGTTYGTRFRFQGLDIQVYGGIGSPESVQTGSVGDWYVRTDVGASDPYLYIKRSGTATTTGWVAVQAGGQIETVEAVTTSKSPTAAESGETYTNEGDTDGATLLLPTAVAGLTYSAYVQAAYTFRVEAASGDTIRITTTVTAAGGSVGSSVVGSYLRLLAINATEWVAVGYLGDWTALASSTVQLTVTDEVALGVTDPPDRAGIGFTDAVPLGVADSAGQAGNGGSEDVGLGVVEQFTKTVV
jgi:hypothetical protein